MSLIDTNDCPCNKCGAKEYCNANCIDYWNWFDDRPNGEPPPLARWERIDEYCNHSKTFRCSACKGIVEYPHFTRFCEYNYCPHCGVKMEE